MSKVLGFRPSRLRPHLRCRSCRCRRREGFVQVARAKKATETETQGERGDQIGRRRALATLETLAELVAAAGFEIIGRPRNSQYTIRGPVDVLSSLLPLRYSAAELEKATSAVERGEALLREGDAAGAVQELSNALETAPWQYKLSQKALLLRSEAYGKLGQDFSKQKGDDFRQEWLWGRGVRWPGWYILAYIFFRKIFVPPDDEDTEEAAAGQIPKEWFVVIFLVILYNALLFKYGLQEY